MLPKTGSTIAKPFAVDLAALRRVDLLAHLIGQRTRPSAVQIVNLAPHLAVGIAQTFGSQLAVATGSCRRLVGDPRGTRPA